MKAYNGAFNGTQAPWTRVPYNIYIYIYIFKFDCPILDFLQIEFYIETLFWENQVTKEGHFPN